VGDFTCAGGGIAGREAAKGKEPQIGAKKATKASSDMVVQVLFPVGALYW